MSYIPSTYPLGTRGRYRANRASIGARIRIAVSHGFRAVIDDIVETAKYMAEGFANSRGQIKQALITSIVFSMVFVVFYSVAFVIRANGDIGKAYTEAYQHSWLSPTQGYTQVHSQEALRAGLVSNTVVQTILTDILHEAPYASRVRLALIHDGVATINGVELLRFDVTNAVAAPGRDPGELLANRSVSEWAPDYIPALMRQDCLVSDVAKLKNADRQARLMKMGITWILGCPVVDVNGQLFGSVLTTWDGNDKPPTGADLDTLIGRIKNYSRQIGTALDMQRLSN